MKNIIDLYEASILDIEDTLKFGDELTDKAEKEFEKIKSAISQHKLWEKKVISFFSVKRTSYRLIFSIKSIAELFQLKPNHLLLIDAIKNDENGNWEICLMLHSTNGAVRDYKSFRKNISQRQVKNFPSLIKLHILPYFTDINTLISIFNERS